MAQVKGVDNTTKEGFDALLSDIKRLEAMRFMHGGKVRGEVVAVGAMPSFITAQNISTNAQTGEKVQTITLAIPIVETVSATGYDTSPDLEFDDTPAAPNPNP